MRELTRTLSFTTLFTTLAVGLTGCIGQSSFKSSASTGEATFASYDPNDGKTAEATAVNQKIYTITISSPVANAAVSGTFALKGSAPGFVNLEVFSSSGSLLQRVKPGSTGSFTASIDSTKLGEGAQSLVIKAWDAPSGSTFNHTAQVSRSVIVVNQYSLTLLSPVANATVSQTIAVTGKAPGHQNIEVFSATGTMLARTTPDSTGAFSASVDTTKLTNGQQSLTIRAWDGPAGGTFTHSAEKTLALNVQNSIQTSPTPVPTPAPTPVPSTGAPTPTASDKNIVNYGAISGGSANNHDAIQNALNAAAAAGVNVYIPAGTFSYSGTLRVPGNVHLFGAGSTSVLRALDAHNETVFLTGDKAKISYLRLTIGWSGVGRQDPFECQRITINNGATNWEVDHVIIEGGSAAGIMASNASYGKIHHSRVQDTLADSIHLTDGSHHIAVYNNEVIRSGDDGIAVVSYKNSTMVHDIQAYNNHIHHNVWARGMSVVGGTNVVYSNNYIHDVPTAACFYVAQENSWQTRAAMNVTLQNNTLQNCGNGNGNHGGILIWGESEPNDQIKVLSNSIVQDNGAPTIAVTSYNTNVSLVNNKVQGPAIIIDSRSQVIQNTPYTSGAVGYSGVVGP